MMGKFTPIIVQAPQLSPQWFEARIGNLTGSKAKLSLDFRAPTKAQMALADAYYNMNSAAYSTRQDYLEKLREYPVAYCLEALIELTPNSARDTYKRQIVAERFTGLSSDFDLYQSKAMLWGQMQERFAKAQYKGITRNHIEDAPLMMHPKLLCGASPDGLVIDIETGELGCLEVKCLEPWNHLYKIVKADVVPDEFIPQIQMQLWITGRAWCDFVGYDPRVKDGLRVYIKRVERDNFYIDHVLVPAIARFLDECDQDERQLYAIRKSRLEKANRVIELPELMGYTVA